MGRKNYIYAYYQGIKDGSIVVGRWIELVYEYLVKGLGDKEAVSELCRKLDELGNRTADEFRSAGDNIGKYADAALNEALERLEQNPGEDVSGTVALLKAMGMKEELDRLADQQTEVGNTTGQEFRSGNVSADVLVEKIMNDALGKLNSNPKADVGAQVAALNELSKTDPQGGKSARDALSNLYDRLDALNNNSGTEYRMSEDAFSRLAGEEFNRAIEKLAQDPKADVSGSVAILKAMGNAETLKQLTDRLDQVGNNSGSRYASSAVSSKVLADKVLEDALAKLTSDPQADMTGSVTALNELKKKNKESRTVAEDALNQLYREMDSRGNVSADDIRTGEAKKALLAGQVLDDAKNSLDQDPKADMSGAAALIKALEQDDMQSQLMNRLDQEGNHTADQFRSASVV